MTPAILAALALALCAALLAKGRREQVWERAEQKRARMIDDLVYGDTVWINHDEDGTHEAPHAGIARLHKELGRGR